ncbi:low molecular weight phosphotyrosine protein phosphatase-like [Symsagittifera roscoffensis]|uniref:low molecular weight phosphotyrosine protein phosphatase-like n=1 Tax=Symsagittifera roscoffensis TaxID=84072 RepID=UPI00307C0050
MSSLSVLFVCHGNICRSTMAQQYLTQMVLKAPEDSSLKKFTSIDSCGTGDDDLGNQPDPGTQTVLKNHGMPPLSHVARMFVPETDSQFDYILCMDNYVMRSVKKYLRNTKTSANIELLGKYDPKGVEEVFNPWMYPVSEFEKVYQHISRSIDEFVKSV